MAKKTVIETLVVELTTDNSRFNRGMKSLQKSLNNIGGSLANFGKRFGRFAVAAFAAIGFAAGRLAQEYDMAMNRVKAVTQSTMEQMQALSDQARYLGRTTARSARQIAEGMETLGLAGFSTQEIQDSIAAVTSLSIISQQEMGKSAQDAANIMAQFGIEAENLTQAVDKLAATATSSNQTVEDLINGLKFAGPIAKQAGLELSEAAAAMGILANNGIRAGIGGRALRMGILKLIAPTAQAAEEIESLGLSISDEVTGEILPFNDILTNVNESIKDLGDAERMATLRILFGTRALGPMNILLREQAIATENGGNAFKDYADMIAASSEEIEGFEGTAAWMEHVMMRGLPGALIYLKSATEGALLSLQDVYKDFLIDVIWGITNLLNAFSDLEVGNSVILDYISNFGQFKEDVSTAINYVIEKIDAFIYKITGVNNVIESMTEKVRSAWASLIAFLEDTFGFNLTGEMTRGAVVDIALLIAAIGPLLVILGTLVSTLGSLVGVFQLVTKTLGSALKIFSMSMPAALLAALSAFVIFKDDTGRYTENIKNFMYDISNAFVWVKDKIFGLLTAFLSLETGRSVFLDYITDFDKLKETAGTAIDTIIAKLDVWILKLTGIEEGTSVMVEYVKTKFDELIEYLEEKFGIDLTGEWTQGMIVDMTALGVAFTALLPLLAPVIAALTSLLALVGTKLVTAFSYLGGTAIPALGKSIGGLVATVNPIVGVITAIAALAGGIGAYVIKTGEDMDEYKERINTVVTEIKTTFGTLSSIVETTLSGIVGEFKALWYELTTGETGEKMAEFTTKLTELFGGILVVVMDLVGNLIIQLGKIFDEIIRTIGPVIVAVTSIVDVIMELLKPAMDAIFSEENREKIKQYFNRVTKVITDLIGIIRGLVNFITVLMKVLKPAITWIGENVLPILEPIFATIIDLGKRVFEIIGGVTGLIKELFGVFSEDGFDTEAFLSEWEGFKDGFVGIFTDLWDNVKEIWDKIKGFFNEFKEKLEEAFDFIFNTNWGLGESNSPAETLDLILSGIEETWTGFKNWLDGLWEEIKEDLSEGWDSVTEPIDTAIDDIKTAWSGFKDWIGGIWEDIKEDVSKGFDTVMQPVKNAFVGLFGGERTVTETYRVYEAAGGLGEKPKYVTKTREVVVKEAGLIVDAFTKVKETIAGLWDGLWEGVTGISATIGDGVSDAISGLKNLFNAVLDPIKDGINSFIDSVEGVINSLVTPINNAFDAISGVELDLGFATISPFSFLDVNLPTADFDGWKLAEGGYVKRKPGGILANIGEGSSDEVVAPVPMLQKLFSEAMENAAATMVKILDSSEMVRQANRSIGTPITPMNAGPRGEGAPQYSFNTSNEFKVDGDVANKIKTILDQQERDRRLKLRGFKT